MELIERCRRAHPGLGWYEMGTAGAAAGAMTVGGVVAVRRAGDLTHARVTGINCDWASVASPAGVRDALESLAQRVETLPAGDADTRRTLAEIATALRPHLSLRVEIGEDGRAVLPEGWELDGAGVARHAAHGGIVVTVSANTRWCMATDCANEFDMMPAPAPNAVMLACIADAMLAERGAP